MNLSTMQRIWRDCMAERRCYPRLRDWLVRLYDRALTRWPKAPLPFRKAVYSVRLLDYPEPFCLRLGSSDWPLLNDIFLYNEYERLLQHDISPRLIVDLGSNIGLTLRVWQRHYPAARILAVEPDPVNASLIFRNNPENGRGKIAVEEACIVGYSRPVKLHKEGGEWGYTVEDAGEPGKNEGGGTITSLTMTELLRRHAPGEMIDLLKCDIEGTEVELFRDCGEWLQKVRFGMIELHGSYRPKDFVRDVGASGVPIDVLWSEETGELSLVFFETRSAWNKDTVNAEEVLLPGSL
jgi:FkbM family methyltransferase